jgi:hypothetical protein
MPTNKRQKNKKRKNRTSNRAVHNNDNNNANASPKKKGTNDQQDKRTEEEILDAYANYYGPMWEEKERKEREEKIRHDLMNEPFYQKRSESRMKDSPLGETGGGGGEALDPSLSKSALRLAPEETELESKNFLRRFQELDHVHTQKAVLTNYQKGLRLVIQPYEAHIETRAHLENVFRPTSLVLRWRVCNMKYLVNEEKVERQKLPSPEDCEWVNGTSTADDLHAVYIRSSYLECASFIYGLLQCRPSDVRSFWIFLLRLMRQWTHPPRVEFEKNNEDPDAVADTIPILQVIYPVDKENHMEHLTDTEQKKPIVSLCGDFRTTWLSDFERGPQ